MINFYFSRKDFEGGYRLLDLFNDIYKDSWFEDEFVLDMIKDVDKSLSVVPGIFKSEYLGNFTAKELSGGIKSLLILLHQEEFKPFVKDEGCKIVLSTALFGSNCISWLLEISKKVDINLQFVHFLEFPLDVKFDGYAPELDVKISNKIDLIGAAFSSEAFTLRRNKYEVIETSEYDY